jgi:hypothetical protein
MVTGRYSYRQFLNLKVMGGTSLLSIVLLYAETLARSAWEYFVFTNYLPIICGLLMNTQERSTLLLCTASLLFRDRVYNPIFKRLFRHQLMCFQQHLPRFSERNLQLIPRNQKQRLAGETEDSPSCIYGTPAQ